MEFCLLRFRCWLLIFNWRRAWYSLHTIYAIFNLPMVAVYSSNNGVLHIGRIRLTGRFENSVGPSFCNANKNIYSIINIRIIIISYERAWHPLQENEPVFSKNIFQKFYTFSKNYIFAYYFSNIGLEMIFCISGESD